MRGIIGWLAALIVGSAGWWLGRKFGFATAVMLSVAGTGVGLYAGHRWFDDKLG